MWGRNPTLIRCRDAWHLPSLILVLLGFEAQGSINIKPRFIRKYAVFRVKCLSVAHQSDQLHLTASYSYVYSTLMLVIFDAEVFAENGTVRDCALLAEDILPFIGLD